MDKADRSRVMGIMEGMIIARNGINSLNNGLNANDKPAA